MNHIISLEQAVDMTTRFRNEREAVLDTAYQGQDILPISETFDVDVFKILIEQGCSSVRVYYGMTEDFKLHAVFVGVNENDEDMIPVDEVNLESIIIEEGFRCPPHCGTPSVLNT